MTLVQLQVFLVVCQEKSFTRAGEVLNMTQSAVSQAISNLEGELGVRLLNRDRNGISITHIGERMLSHARSIMQHTYEMRQETTAAAGILRGTLRIAMIPHISAHLLPGLVSSFQSSHPSIQITVLEGTTDEVNSWLMNQMVDTSFTTLPADGLDIAGFMNDEFMAFVSTEHALAKQKEVSLKQLLDDPYIQLKGDTANFLKDAFKQQSLTRTVQYEVSETSTILAMVEQKMGITILPKMAITACPPSVVRIELKPSMIRQVQFAVRDMNRIPPICADFLLYVNEQTK